MVQYGEGSGDHGIWHRVNSSYAITFCLMPLPYALGHLPYAVVPVSHFGTLAVRLV